VHVKHLPVAAGMIRGCSRRFVSLCWQQLPLQKRLQCSRRCTNNGTQISVALDCDGGSANRSALPRRLQRGPFVLNIVALIVLPRTIRTPRRLSIPVEDSIVVRAESPFHGRAKARDVGRGASRVKSRKSAGPSTVKSAYATDGRRRDEQRSRVAAKSKKERRQRCLRY